MAKTVCKAVKTGQVPQRGKPTLEWHDKDGKPQYYCYGYIDKRYDVPIPVCEECRDNVMYAQEDLEKYNLEN